MIRSNPHTRNVAADVSSAVIELATDDNGVTDLLQQLVYNKVALTSFADREPTLEDVFMKVVQRLKQIGDHLARDRIALVGPIENDRARGEILLELQRIHARLTFGRSEMLLSSLRQGAVAVATAS